jgi:MscS family membrane protein
MRSLKLFSVAVFVALAPLTAQTVSAQTPTLKQVIETDDTKTNNEKSAEKKPVKRGPADELDRGTPRSSARGYFVAANEGDYERAARYLDLRSVPRRQRTRNGTDLAENLKVILDRTLWVVLDELSDEPEGFVDDGFPANVDLIGRVPLGKGSVDILIQRVPRSDGVLIWKISASTVRKIPQLYDEHGLSPAAEWLAKKMPGFKFLGLELWQWVGLFGLLVVAYLVTIIPVWFTNRLLSRSGKPLAQKMTELVAGPIRWLVILTLTTRWMDFIQPTVEARAIMQAGTLRIIITTWALIRGVDLFKLYWEEKLRQSGRDYAVVLLRPAASTANIFIVLTALVVWLDNVGYEVTTLVAGLGIGGLAVALAAQKSIENIIGALTLYMSAPVRVGDFCRFGDKYGTVEEIGLRSTRVRTLDKTVISIPNADFAAMPLENFAGRDQFPYRPRVSLRYTTTAEQVEKIVSGIETLLQNHERVVDSPLRARFKGFGTASLEIDVLSYISTSDFNEYLKFAEELNLGIMKLVQDAGAEFTLPVEGLIESNGG